MYDLETSGKQEHRQNSTYNVTRNTHRVIMEMEAPGNTAGTKKNKYNKQANKIKQEVTNAETRTKTH